MSRLLVVAALLLAATGCNRYQSANKQAPLAADPPYVFPHETHADLDCTECHAPVTKATRLEQGVRHVEIPKFDADGACAGCHSDASEIEIKLPRRNRPFRFNFSHADHMPRVKDCGACHTALTEPGDKEPRVPPMATCTGCHTHQKDFAEARCTPCHVDLKGYFPVSAYAHEANFLRVHGNLARPVAESCAQCHDQTYCAECHASQTTPVRPSILYPERVERSFIHRGDYVSRHTIDARVDGASCKRCHGSNFCDSCHRAQGVSERNPLIDVHPAGWAVRGQGSRFHGDAARRDITSCSGCHDQAGAQSLCVQCHSVGNSQTSGLGPNGPHPASFVSKHRGESKSKNAMCLACHTAG